MAAVDGKTLENILKRTAEKQITARGKAAVTGEIGGYRVDRRRLRIVGIRRSSCHRHCTFAAAIVLWETPVSCYREIANGIRHTA